LLESTSNIFVPESVCNLETPSNFLSRDISRASYLLTEPASVLNITELSGDAEHVVCAGSDAHLLSCLTHLCPLQHQLALVQVVSFPGRRLLPAGCYCRLCSTSVRTSHYMLYHTVFSALCRSICY